jgi:hypothetical protein
LGREDQWQDASFCLPDGARGRARGGMRLLSDPPFFPMTLRVFERMTFPGRQGFLKVFLATPPIAY